MDESGTIEPFLPPNLTAADAPGGLIPRLAALVQACPDAVVVADEQQRVTFARLARQAAVTRARVLAEGDGAEPVALVHSHTAGAVGALLGVLASGRPLVVLDPRAPRPRLRLLGERAGVRLCLADAACADQAAAVAARVLPAPSLDAGLGPAAEQESALEQLWAKPPDAGAPAFLAFTSGTTGRPKVVSCDHRMLLHDAWRNSVGNDCYGPGDVVAHTLPIAFFAGMLATLAGVMSGATLQLYDIRAAGIGGFAPWIRRSGVNVALLSPAIARALVAAAPDPALLAGLRTVSLAGEPVYGRDARRLRALLSPQARLRNRYGSSETGLISDYVLAADQELPDGPLPAGRPVGVGQVTIVDVDGAPVPDGQPGVVAITGRYLSSGYWDDPEATAEVFTRHPDGTCTYRSKDVGRWEGGLLQLIGRRDYSVKIRGYLVEPGEVDAALFALPDVREAVTVAVPQPDGAGHRLVAYVVSTAERPSAAAIRAGLRAALPGHMVPNTVVFLEALPRTERGKIDRAALPPAPPPVGGTAPISAWEGTIAEAWAKVLELDDVPRDADFFELGGDSLAAEALISLVTGQLGVPPDGVSTALLVEAPTVAEFARRLHRRPDREHPTLTRLRPEGSRPPLFLIAGGGALGVGFVPLVRRLPEDQPCYALHSHGLETRAIPDWSVRSAARRHVATLRAVQPRGPYYLAGHSFGGVLAFEMAQQLRRAGEQVGLLVILDSFPPDPDLVPNEPARSLPGRLKYAVGLALTGLVPTPGVGHYWRFHTQSSFLARHYRSEPYHGRALVLVANSPESQARAQWGPHLSGAWQLHEVPGDHYAFLREPLVATSAEIITEALAASRVDQAGLS